MLDAKSHELEAEVLCEGIYVTDGLVVHLDVKHLIFLLIGITLDLLNFLLRLLHLLSLCARLPGYEVYFHLDIFRVANLVVSDGKLHLSA